MLKKKLKLILGMVTCFAKFLKVEFVNFVIQVSQLTPCHGCPPLEAPVHGLVTISTLEAGNNVTHG